MIFDLSHSLENNMPLYPGTADPKFETVHTVENDGYKESQLKMCSHVGTHIDAPSHMLSDGRSLDLYPISYFTGKAIVVPCFEMEITKRHLESYLVNSGDFDFVLVHTNWSNYWGQEKYFKEFPVLTKEACEFILSLNIKGIGLDTPSIDPFHSREYENHMEVFKADGIIIENLKNLTNVSGQLVEFNAFPLSLKNADGAPVRAVAKTIKQ